MMGLVVVVNDLRIMNLVIVFKVVKMTGFVVVVNQKK